MIRPNAIHHLAISTADLKAQLEYFTDVLGTELVALYWMHGVEGAWHAFLRLDDRSSIALVQSPETQAIAGVMGVSHAGNPRAPSAPGTMQHLALNVDSDEALLAMRDRIRARGVIVLGPIDHGMCRSIYFAGPENLSLEIATSPQPIDARAWIDPEVVRLAGISAEELARFRSPRRDEGRGGAVPQPPHHPDKPHQVFPEAQYRQLIALPDAVLTEMLSQSAPPVDVR